MKLSISSLLITLMVAAVLPGCGGGGGRAINVTLPDSPPILSLEEARQPGAWTILVYLDADNDLESAGIANFNQMEMIGSTKDVRVIVQMDRKTGCDASNGDWTDTRRYLITRDSDNQNMHSIRLDNPALGEVDMANWRSLQSFADWGMREFPAEHYCLIIWDHGSGWQIRANAELPQYRYVISDDSSYNAMNITDIAQALDSKNLDVIGFDACYMQQLEVAYELRNCANYMLASTAAEPSPGYNYSGLLARMGAGTTAEELCRISIEEFMRIYPPPYKGITLSTVDLTRIGEVAQATSSLAQILRENSRTYASALRYARQQTCDYSTIDGATERYSLDLVDYASRCTTALNPAANAAYASLQDAISYAVIAKAHNPDTPYASGLGIYIPPPGSYDTKYGLLDLAADTQWDEWLRAQVQ